MAYSRKSYVEHVAIKVKDIDWHIRFFNDVLGMTVHEVMGSDGATEKAWTLGGMQFNVYSSVQFSVNGKGWSTDFKTIARDTAYDEKE